MAKAFIVRTLGTSLDWMETRDMVNIVGTKLDRSYFGVEEIVAVKPPEDRYCGAGEDHADHWWWPVHGDDAVPVVPFYCDGITPDAETDKLR